MFFCCRNNSNRFCGMGRNRANMGCNRNFGYGCRFGQDSCCFRRLEGIETEGLRLREEIEALKAELNKRNLVEEKNG